jgi:hypothetical protein
MSGLVSVGEGGAGRGLSTLAVVLFVCVYMVALSRHAYASKFHHMHESQSSNSSSALGAALRLHSEHDAPPCKPAEPWPLPLPERHNPSRPLPRNFLEKASRHVGPHPIMVLLGDHLPRPLSIIYHILYHCLFQKDCKQIHSDCLQLTVRPNPKNLFLYEPVTYVR